MRRRLLLEVVLLVVLSAVWTVLRPAEAPPPPWTSLDGRVFRSTGGPGHSTYRFQGGRCQIEIQSCMGHCRREANYVFRGDRVAVIPDEQPGWTETFVLQQQEGCTVLTGHQVLEHRSDLE